MKQLSDSQLIKIPVNGQHTFFLNQNIISTYSAKLKKLTNEKNKTPQRRISVIEINDFPGGANGFDLISRFCYNNGRINITPSNVSILYCCSIFLEMTDKVFPYNLVHQTEAFLDGLFYWSWTDVLLSLKGCECFFSFADSSGLLGKLIASLLSRICQSSDCNMSSSSSYSSPEPRFRFSSSNKTTPESIQPNASTKAWWFDDLTILSPKIIEKVVNTMGCYGTDNNSLILTTFLLHYLKSAFHTKRGNGYGSKWCSEYGGLADTAVHGVVLIGKTSFSCRGLFWVLRIVSGLGLSKECRDGMERVIGGVLEKATLDDLLVSGHDGVGVYDVNLVLRLVRVFVSSCCDEMSMQRMKKVGRLVDKYMGEISPDHNLKVSKFLAVAESLPDCARDCFDGVYRAIDIYIESHLSLSFEERSKLCRCLNYEKLSLEACKDLAKNPRIPPRIAIQALVSQKSKFQTKENSLEKSSPLIEVETDKFSEYSDDGEEMKQNLQKMQWRVMELEKVCKEMKSQMSKMVNNKDMSSPAYNRATLPTRLC